MEAVLTSLGSWAWWIVAGAMFLLELLVPAFFFLWFGFAALATALIVLFVPMTWQWEVGLFAVLSVICLFISRKYFAREGAGTDKPHLNKRMASFIGKTYALETPIKNRQGKVRINDTMWKVNGPDAPSGTWVKVVDSDGSVLIVELEPQ